MKLSDVLKPEAPAAAPKCECGVEAAMRKVRKPGDDFGKTFFVCGSEDGKSCDFSRVGGVGK